MKLFNLKKFLTLQEAARHLSIIFDEEVSESDVLRLALDDHLTLSVNFINQAEAEEGKFVPFEEAGFYEFPSHLSTRTPPPDQKGDPIKLLKGLQLEDDRVLEFDEKVVTMDGLFDLPMLGSEILDVEHKYQMLTGGPAVTLQGLDGAFVSDGAGTIYKLLQSRDENEYLKGSSGSLRKIEKLMEKKVIDAVKARELIKEHEKAREVFLTDENNNRVAGLNRRNYHPAGGLPIDSVLVVRTGALREFEQSFTAPPETNAKPVTARERNTLLTIIAALCDYSAVDLTKRDCSKKIMSMTEELGAPVSDETIHKYLQMIPGAVERRMK